MPVKYRNPSEHYVQRLLREKGYKQRDLAKALQISANNVRKAFKQSDEYMTMGRIKTIAGLLGLPIPQIVGYFCGICSGNENNWFRSCWHEDHAPYGKEKK